MTLDLIRAVRLQFELAEVEAIVRDYRNGYVSYTPIVWRYGNQGLQACRAAIHQNHLPLL